MLARADDLWIDYDEPINAQAPMAQGLVYLALPLPQRMAGPTLYALGPNKSRGALTGFTAGYGWSSEAPPGGWGSLKGNGTAGYVQLADTAALDLTGDLSCVAWVKTTATGVVYYASYDSASPYNGYGFGIGTSGTAGQLSFWNGYAWKGAGAAVNDGKWHCLGFSYVNVGTSCSFLIDGFLAGTVAMGGPTPSYTGNKYLLKDSASTYFPGNVGMFALYSRFLSQPEHVALLGESRSYFPTLLRRRKRSKTYLLPLPTSSYPEYLKMTVKPMVYTKLHQRSATKIFPAQITVTPAPTNIIGAPRRVVTGPTTRVVKRTVVVPSGPGPAVVIRTPTRQVRTPGQPMRSRVIVIAGGTVNVNVPVLLRGRPIVQRSYVPVRRNAFIPGSTAPAVVIRQPRQLIRASAPPAKRLTVPLVSVVVQSVPLLLRSRPQTVRTFYPVRRQAAAALFQQTTVNQTVIVKSQRVVR